MNKFDWLSCDICGGYGVEEQVEGLLIQSDDADMYGMEVTSPLTPAFGVCPECLKDVLAMKRRGSWRGLL